MAQNRYIVRFFLTIALIFGALLYTYAADRYSVASTAWNLTSTWSATSGGAPGASVPIAGDNVYIEGQTVSITAAAACANLNIAAGSTLSVGGVTFTVSSSTNISGTFSATSATGTKSLGAVTFNGGTFNNTATNNPFTLTSLTLSNSTMSGTRTAIFSISGDMVITTGTTNTIGNITLTIAGQSIINGTAIFNNTGGNKNFNGGLTVSNGTITSSVGETYTISSLTLSGSTIGGTATGIFNVSGALIATTATSNTIGRSTITVSGATTVDGTLTFNSNTGTKTFIGLVTINGTWTESAAVAVVFRNGITNNGTFTASTGTHTFNTNSQALNGIFLIPRVTVAGVTLSNNNTLTVTTALAGNGGLTNLATGILNLNFTGAVGITTLTAIASGNLVNYGFAGTQTIKATTYYHLTISGSGTKTLAAATTVNGNLTISAGTLSTGNFSITGNATGTFSMAAGTTLNLGSGTTAIAFPTNYVTANITLDPTSTIVYNSNQALNISTAPSAYGNLTLTATSTKTATSPLTINGNLTVNTGNTFAIGTNTITIKKNLAITGTCSGTGKLLLTGGSAVHAISGGTSNICNLELDDTNGATFAGTGTTTITGNLTVTTGTLTVNAINTALVVTGATTINGSFIIASTAGTKTFTGLVTNNGTWIESVNEAITFRGGITNNGTFTANTGLHTFNTNSQVINGTNPITFGGGVTTTVPLTISNSSTFTVTGVFTISGAVTVTNNTTVTVTGNLIGSAAGSTWLNAANSTLNVGAAVLTTGTLTATADQNTVNYTGASQTVKATTYHNLTINGSGTATITGTNTINGTLTINSNLTNNGTLTVTTGIAGSATFTNTLILNYAGSGAITPTLLANTGTNTVNYTGGNQIVNVSNYVNLTLSGSGIKTLNNGINVTGTLTMNSPVTAQLTDGGNTYVGTTLTINGVAQPVNTYGSTSSLADVQNDTWFIVGYTGIITRSTCIPGTWSGATSTDWNTASNWCGGVPTATTDVIIPNVARDPIIGAAGAVCRNITITTGILGFSGAYNLAVSGDWENTGTFNRGTSTVTFNGSSQQTISGGTNNFNNLTLDNPNGLSLGGAVTVSNTLTLTNGQLSLGSNNLTISSNVAGSFSSSAMIVPEGTGNLIRNFTTMGTYSFPVGSSSPAVYSPASLTINAGTNGAINVKLQNNQDLSADYDSYLSRAFTITASGITNYDVTFDYANGDIIGNEDHLYSGKSQDNGVSWTLGNAVNAGSNQFSLTGQTSFSKFSAVGKLGATASADPTTICQGGDVALTGGATGGKTPYTWSWVASPATGVTYSPDAASQSPTATFANSGSYTLTLTVTDNKGRTANASTSTITVNATNTITLTSGAGTNNQTVSKNTALTPITYSTTGATGADVTDLPSGVSGVWAANVVTISGTPTEAGIFDYTVTLTGGCGVVTATGTLTVSEVDVTVVASSPSNECPELDEAKGFVPDNNGPYSAGATDVVFEVEWLLTVQEWQFTYTITEAASLAGFTVQSVNAVGTTYSSTINNASGTFLAIPATTQTLIVTVRVTNIPGSQQDVVFDVTNAKYTDDSYSVNYTDNESNIVIKAMPVVGAFN